MKRFSLLATILCVCLVSTSFAHFEAFTEDMSLGASIDLVHNDAAEWKGWIDVTVTNTGLDPWGDFHFTITGTSAFFSDAAATGVILDGAPVITDTTVDFFFYGDPMIQGDSATFSVYTNNPDMLSFFTLSITPTPVPEPATLALLGVGGLALLRRKK